MSGEKQERRVPLTESVFAALRAGDVIIGTTGTRYIVGKESPFKPRAMAGCVHLIWVRAEGKEGSDTIGWRKADAAIVGEDGSPVTGLNPQTEVFVERKAA